MGIFGRERGGNKTSGLETQRRDLRIVLGGKYRRRGEQKDLSGRAFKQTRKRWRKKMQNNNAPELALEVRNFVYGFERIQGTESWNRKKVTPLTRKRPC